MGHAALSSETTRMGSVMIPNGIEIDTILGGVQETYEASYGDNVPFLFTCRVSHSDSNRRPRSTQFIGHASYLASVPSESRVDGILL